MTERLAKKGEQSETVTKNRLSLREKLILKRQHERAVEQQLLPEPVLSSPLFFEIDEISEEIEPEIPALPQKEFTMRSTIRTDHRALVSEVVQSASQVFTRKALTSEEQEIALGLAVWIMNPGYIYDLAAIKHEDPETMKRKIVSNVCDDELRRMGGEIVDVYHDTKHPGRRMRVAQRHFNKVFRDIPKNSLELLTKREAQIFSEANNGTPIGEIAEKFGLNNKERVSEILSSARKKIQKQILFPEGIKKVSSYNDKGVLYASSRGALTAKKFLGEYYTTDEFAREYFINHTNRVDTDLISKGYILLQDLLSPEDYEKARKKRTKFSSFITYHQKRLYVSPENRAKVMALAAGETLDRKPVNADAFPNHRTLRNIARNSVEYSRLKVGVRKGLLPAVKTNYATMVLAEDVEAFLAAYYPEEIHEPSPEETTVFPEPS